MRRFMKNRAFRLFMSLALVISTLAGGILPVQAADSGFKDVPAGAYYAESVGWAVDQGITKGTSDTTFSPGAGCTRGQCVTFLYRYAGSPATDSSKASKFKDVGSNAFYADAVAWAVENGVTSGTSETTFSPDAMCTRAQIVTFLWRFRGQEKASQAGAFEDVRAGAYYADAVAWAVEQDITKGVSETKFGPEQTCTRAQIVTFLYRMDQSSLPSGSGSSVDVYAVTKLNMSDDNGQAVAVVSAAEDCTLLVRFIEEDIYFSENYPDNKAYIANGNVSGSQAAAAGTDMEPVTVEIANTDYLPEHFVAEAVLVDGNGEPLCQPFSSIEKTARSELFEAETVNSFPDANLVLNFDPSLSNNFGVLADDVRVITADNITRKEDTDEYVITNPSAGINAGDKVFVSSADSEALFKAASVKTSGNTCTVVSAQADDAQNGFALEDFYKYLKVDMGVEIDENGAVRTSESSGEAELSEEEMAELAGINVMNVYHDVSGEASLSSSPISFQTTHFEIKGKIEGKIKAELVVQWDAVLFGEDYFRFDLETKNSFELTVNMNGKWGSDNNEELQEKLKDLEEKKTLKLGKLVIPFGVTGFDAYTELELMVKWKLTAGAELKGTVENTGGFKYNTKDGYQKVDQKKSTWSVSIKGHAEISLGPTASIGVEFLNGVVSAGVECFLGGKAEGDAVIPVAQGGDERHACHLCVEGEIKLVVDVDAKLEYKITEHFQGTPIDFNIVKIERKLFDFYCSLLNEADSMFGGKMNYGTGSCPNKEYKTTVKAVDGNGNQTDASIEIRYQKNGAKRADVASGSFVYLPPANYTAITTIDGVACQKTFTVSDRAQTVKLTPGNATDPNDPNGNGSGNTEKTPFKQKYWVIFTEGYRNGRLEASTIDSTLPADQLYIIWDTSADLNDKSGSGECDQYYLDENDKWSEIGTYWRLTDWAVDIIASNLDVYDANGNLILAKTDYSTIDLGAIKKDLSLGGSITDSWSQIIASVNDGTYKSKYKLGDTKALDLGDEGIVEMQIVAFDADELADGSGKAAITWISKQVLNTMRPMNGSVDYDYEAGKYVTGTGSIGGWEYSEMRSWLKSDVMPLIPLSVRNAIKPVTKYSSSYEESAAFTRDTVTVDDIWIPSYREIFGDSTYYETGGPTYKTMFATREDRLKDHTKLNISPWWWLRTAYYNIVNGKGSNYVVPASDSYTGDRSTCEYGVAIGFCM